MTALVLGATGLIGSQVRAELARQGLEPVGTSTRGEGENLALDLTDPVAVADLIDRIRPGLVVDAAGISSLAAAWEEPSDCFRVNSTGTLNLLEALRRHAPGAHLLFTSTAAVYGPPEPGQPSFSEEAPPRPVSPYAASKAAAEVLCGQYARQYETSISVVRLFNQVGPGQSVGQAPSEFAREIALAEANGLDRVEVQVGNPDAERDFTVVSDTARAIAALTIGRQSGTFNVCSGRPTSLREVIRLLSESTRLEVVITDKPDHDRPADVQRIVGSAAKLEATTGWRAEIPLGDGLALLLADWRAGRIRPYEH